MAQRAAAKDTPRKGSPPRKEEWRPGGRAASPRAPDRGPGPRRKTDVRSAFAAAAANLEHVLESGRDENQRLTDDIDHVRNAVEELTDLGRQQKQVSGRQGQALQALSAAQSELQSLLSSQEDQVSQHDAQLNTLQAAQERLEADSSQHGRALQAHELELRQQRLLAEESQKLVRDQAEELQRLRSKVQDISAENALLWERLHKLFGSVAGDKPLAQDGREADVRALSARESTPQNQVVRTASVPNTPSSIGSRVVQSFGNPSNRGSLSSSSQSFGPAARLAGFPPSYPVRYVTR